MGRPARPRVGTRPKPSAIHISFIQASRVGVVRPWILLRPIFLPPFGSASSLAVRWLVSRVSGVARARSSA
eukprot:7379323-Prymnesium_polylepis.1